MQFQAEKTIRDHNPRHAASRRLLVKDNDGKFYPKDPDNNYVSRFPDRFCGCLGCGFIDRVFRACPQQSDPVMKPKFYKDIHTHVPSTRKTVSFTNHTATPTSNINVLSTHTNPSSRSFIKKPRFFAILHALIISPRLPKNQYQFNLIIICLLFASTLGWLRMTKIRCGCYSILDPLWTLVTWTTIFG